MNKQTEDQGYLGSFVQDYTISEWPKWIQSQTSGTKPHTISNILDEFIPYVFTQSLLCLLKI